MNYKYKKSQLIGKKLDVPKYILNKVYKCSISLSEFIEYDLYDKVPISCIIESDRKIVEKFGMEKIKFLDLELLNQQVYYKNIDFKELLMSIEANTEDINKSLYELVKDQIKPNDYSEGMKKIYSDRFFEISPDDEFYYIKKKFNDGRASLEEIVSNWDFYKDKDLSYCLLNDIKNDNQITDKMLKSFMANYGAIIPFIINNNSIYTFINGFFNLSSEDEKHSYLKQITDEILSSDYKVFKLTDEQYEVIFKYSSIEDYLKVCNEWKASSIIQELRKLPKDYIFKISIPLTKLLNYKVLSFIATYGLKNVVDFDNECGHFFTKNNCEMLELMDDMYLHYASNEHNPNKTIYTKNNIDKNGNYIDRPYTKDEFYEAMKRMIIYGPSDWNFIDKAPDYREMTGEFRIRNAELFISDHAPEELQKLFYTKSINPQLLSEHPDYIQYLRGKNLGSCFKNREIQIEGSNSYYGYENIYNFLSSKTDFNGVMNFITEYSDALEIIFNTSGLLFYNPLSHDLKINIEDSLIDIEKQFDELIKSVKFKCVLEFLKIQDVELQKAFKEYIMEVGQNIDEEKIQYISEILTRLSLSNSSEIFTFRKELATQLLKSNNPLESLSKIEDIFIRNNIPVVGKIYSCFEILHPDFQGFDFDLSTISPVLKKSSTTNKRIIVFSDLIKSSFGSNNKSVNAYLKNIEFGSNLYESIKSNKVQLSSLGDAEIKELVLFSNYLATLYNNTMKAKELKEIFIPSGNVLYDILELSKRLSPNGTLDYNLADRVIKMFCGFTGINTLEQAKKYIQKKIKSADSRNREASNSDMVLEYGDFIKGIGDITYLRNILQNGSVSKEYLGSSAGSDATPLDTDISMITSLDGTIDEKMNDTAAAGYGPIWFVLKNDDRFITTRTSSETIGVKNDISKLEVFYTGFLGKDHYGIRTGFASSEINYIVMENYDPRVGLEIAMNGFYIPVANKEGKIIFTPNDYDELREKMSGLSYFGEQNYSFSANLVTEETEYLAEQIDQNHMEVEAKRGKIYNIIKKSFEEFGLHLKTSIDGDLTEGYIELIDTGSTGRGTNKPGEGDFDFMIRLDKSILSNLPRLNEMKQIILKNLGRENSSELTTTGDFRLKNVQIDNETIVDIDITFTGKTDKVSYSTDLALQDRLETIRRIDPEKYKYVVANILLAKKILKDADVYKPNRGEIPQGGLGGVGVENWILQNGGSFIDSARSFVEAAEGKDFAEFQSSYQIWDFGDNHLAERRGQYAHDNFVANNMSEEGYEKMVQALKDYLKDLQISYEEIEDIKR